MIQCLDKKDGSNYSTMNKLFCNIIIRSSISIIKFILNPAYVQHICSFINVCFWYMSKYKCAYISYMCVNIYVNNLLFTLNCLTANPVKKN